MRTHVVPKGTFNPDNPLRRVKEKEGHALSPMGNPPRYRSSSMVLADRAGTAWERGKERDDAKAKGRGWNTTWHPRFMDGHVKEL